MAYDSISSAYIQMQCILESTDDEITAYHGTNAHAYSNGKIERFNTNTERGAAFFSSDHAIANQYGEKTYKVGINLKNPLIVHGDGQHWSDIKPTTKVSGGIPDGLRKVDTDKTKALNDIYKELDPEDDFVAKGKFDGHSVLGSHHELSHLTSENSTDGIAKAAKKFGYDGVIFHDIHDEPVADKHLYKPKKSNVYAVFDSNRIRIHD